MAVGNLMSITLDCADPAPLAQFWAQVLGGTIAHTTEDFVGVETPAGVWLGAYRVNDYEPPVWPDGPVGKQFHLDLSVEDLDVAERAAIGLGAVKSGHQENPSAWRVLFDPAGHPFCLTSFGG